MPAHRGQARLVPPTWIKTPELVSYTLTPVFGSASAATSGTLRKTVLAPLAPLMLLWKLGSDSNWLMPPPVSDQALSEMYAPLLWIWRFVPPTATTPRAKEGKPAGV